MNPLLTPHLLTQIRGAAWRLALIALLLGGLVPPAHAQYDPFDTPVIDSVRAAEDSIGAASADSAASPESGQHPILRGLNTLDDVLPSRLMEVLIVLGFVVVPLVSAAGFAVVALFSGSGWLRALLAIMGWLAALLGGLTGGGLLGTLLGGGLSFFIWTGVIVGGVGYPILFARIRGQIKQLPREEYLTWKHALTGGALVGTGAGTAASLARSAGALFKGGGGNFGGGGASGTFGGGPIVPVTAAATPGTGASSAAAWTSNATSVAAAAPAAGMASIGAPSAPTDAAAPVAGAEDERRAMSGSRVERWTRYALSFVRRLRWYHSIGFALVLLVFVPVGMGITATLERPYVLLGIAVILTMLRGSWLVARLAPKVLGFLPVLAFFLSLPAMGAVAGSQAPQWHLTVTVAIAVVVEIGYHVLPNNLPETMPHPDRDPNRKTPFRGGRASERW